MAKQKAFIMVLLIVLVCVSVEGCAFTSTNSKSKTNESKTEWIDTSKPTTVENYAEYEDKSLFDDLFIPAVQGNIEANLEEFMAEATAYGFNCTKEAGILLVQDPNNSECFLRCELVRDDVEHIKVSKLVYHCSLGPVERQVTAAGIDAGQITYYVGTSEYSEGTQVSSLEEVQTYLKAEISPEETATGASETALGLFDNVLVPLAEGSLLNQAGAFKKVLEQYGYIYKDGEGLFTVYDPEHPENYLFGGNSLLQDTDSIATLGFSLETETGSKRVEVYFFTEVPKYYTYNADFNQVEVESFEQIKEYIAQK